MTAPHIAAHKRSAHHRVELKASARCGCFYCLETFVPTDVVDWIDDQQTALCPRCGIDSVIGDASGFPVDRAFLQTTKKHWS